ncbi:MAG: type II toxin-antitoxin system HicB family antitoxin [Magnetococcales bacterium]|nr:type II toxin-antitoxin system HicB family antitoxin [Magnetococcales bacterium]
MDNLDAYPFEIRPLSKEEGGGFLISYPDFNQVISDGESVEEATTNGRDALKTTILALQELGFPVPKPGSSMNCTHQDSIRLTSLLSSGLDFLQTPP